MKSIISFSPTEVKLSDGTILTCDKSKNQEFDYDVIEKILNNNEVLNER